MHFKKPRRSIPSWLWFTTISSFPRATCFFLATRPGRSHRRWRKLEKRNKLAPPLDVFCNGDQQVRGFIPGRKNVIPQGSHPCLFAFFSLNLPTKGNKIEAAVVIANRDDRGGLGRGRTGREKTVRRMRPAASRCRF